MLRKELINWQVTYRRTPGGATSAWCARLATLCLLRNTFDTRPGRTGRRTAVHRGQLPGEPTELAEFEQELVARPYGEGCSSSVVCGESAPAPTSIALAVLLIAAFRRRRVSS
jgi:hypothetical protein